MAIVRTTESAYEDEIRKSKCIAHSPFTFTGRIPNRIPVHDRSCLEMSEADGVDSGAICKRGFIHLQFAEKPEAPEAERHLGSWILE
ncbi:hypothetical protein V1477_013454 [Vespula maculifrons]|uniref:Uncharacterized protein n=1 Tax=Vespula maculifrons TaxID=7453 RepID=A0ABD2BQJ4_VESMC